MKRPSCLALASLALLLTACAPTFAPFAVPSEMPSPTASAVVQPRPTATLEPTPTLTPTPATFVAAFTPLPSETPLPTLELPTRPPRAQATQVWDGLPTYRAESRPNFYFRLRFDPNLWVLTTDHFGFPALVHREVANCILSAAPLAGRGLPPNAVVEHATLKLGAVNYEVAAVYVNGIKRFVTYTGGDLNVYTAFEVSFQDALDPCLNEAENVLATLTSLPASQATPVPAP